LLRFPGFARGQLNVDESQWMAEAITLQEDPRYYLSTISSGPFISYFIVFMTWFGATVNYGVVKLLATIIWVAVAFFTFKSFKNFFNSSIAGILTLPLVTVVSLFTFWDYVAYNSEHAPIFFISLGLYLFSRVYKKGDKARPIDYYLVGFVLGCVPFSKTQAAPVAFAIGVYLIYYFGINKSRYLVAGAFSFPLLVLGYLLALDLFPVFMNSLFNQVSYAQDYGGLNTLSFIEKLSHYPSYIFMPHDTRYYFRTQLFFIVLTIVTLFLFRKHLPSNHLKLIGLAVLYLVVSFYVLYQPGTVFYHYILFLVTPVSFLSGILIGSLFRTPPVVGLSSKTKTILLGVYLIAASIIPCFFVLEAGNVAFVAGKYNADEDYRRNRIARVIQKYKKENDRLSVWGWANDYHVLTGLPQGTRYTTSVWQIKPFPQQSTYLDIYLSDLEKNKPTFFLDAVAPYEFTYKDAGEYGHQNFPQIKAFIDKHYNYVDNRAGVRIYVHKDREVDHIIVPGVEIKHHTIETIDKVELPPDTTSALHSYILLEEGLVSFSINNGWAIVEGINSRLSRSWIILKSDSKQYIYPTRKFPRHEIANMYGSEGYIQSGMQVHILKKDLEKGTYKVGILITYGQKVVGYKFTGKHLVRNFYPVELYDQKLKETNNIDYNLKVSKDRDYYRLERSWAAAKNTPPWGNKTFLVLRSKEGKYIYSVQSHQRRDLVSRYSQSYLNAGFNIELPKDQIRAGSYQVGLLITHGKDILGFQFTNERLNIKKRIDWLSVKIPEATNNVQNYLILTEDRQTFQIKNGWALVKGLSSYQSETFIVLKSEVTEKIFDTTPVDRVELAAQYGHRHLRSGFESKIPKNDLTNGKYKIGLLIVDRGKQEIAGFQYTDKEIVIKHTYVGGIPVDKELPPYVELPKGTDIMKHAIEVSQDINSIFINKGWAFIEDINSKSNQVYVTLKSDQAFYVFSTDKNKRHELAKIYAPKYVESGFTLKVSKDIIKAGTYHIGLIVAQGEKMIGVKTTKKEITINQ